MWSCATCRPCGPPGPAPVPSAGNPSTPTPEPRPNEALLGVVVHEAVVGGGYGRGGPAVPVLERRGLTATAPAEASAAAHESPEASGSGRLGGWLDRVSVPAGTSSPEVVRRCAPGRGRPRAVCGWSSSTSGPGPGTPGRR